MVARLCLLSASVSQLLPSPAAATPTEREAAYFRNYGVEQGLSQNSVVQVLQDSDGFLWIATQDGLNRFDGYDFVVVRAEPGSPRSLSNSDVSALAEDRAGRLWIGTTTGGLNLYDRSTERVQRVVIEGTLEGDDRIVALCGLSDGTAWVGKEDGLVRVTGYSGGMPEAAPLAASGALPGRAHIADVECMPDGDLWVATRNHGLYFLGARDSEFRPVPLPAEPRGDPPRLMVLARGDEGAIWVGSDGPAMYRVNREGSVQAWEVPGVSVRLRDLLADEQGTVWIAGLGTGLLRFDPRTERFADYGGLDDPTSGINDRDTYSLCIDRAGVLWVGTLSGGLSNLALESGGFERFTADPERPDGLGHKMVTSFAEQDGKIWIGTDGGGLHLFDPQSRSFAVYRKQPDKAGALRNDRVWAVLVDEEGALWVGTWGGGVLRKARGEQDFKAVEVLPAQGPTSPRNVTALAEDQAGNVWIGTQESGLYRWQPSTRLLEPVVAGTEGDFSFTETSIPDLQATKDGALLIATWGDGLFRLGADGRLDRWRHDPDDDATLANDTVRAIAEDSDGSLWLGTAGGLTLFDPAAGRATGNYGTAEGLPASVIYAAVPDDAGRVWVSSNRGIVRFDPETRNARSYDPGDGLQGFEFNGAAALSTSDGYIYFGGTNGFNRFRPSALRDNPFPPAVVLTEFLLFNEVQRPAAAKRESLLDRTLFATEEIVLRHDQDVIAIQFAALHFVSPERNQYAYRLDGFDRDWTYTDASRRIATYTNLDPGSYRFRVKAANSDGLWTDDEATVQIRVLAPWWVTPVAQLSYVLAAILLITLFVRWRTLLLRQRAVELQRMVRDRTRLISEQKDTIEEQARKVEQVLHSKEQLFARVSHEFRTPLTLILGSLDRLREMLGGASAGASVDTIESSGRRLLRLVDQLLGLASLAESRTAEPVPQALHAITRFAVTSFESLAESKQLALSADRIDDAWVKAPPEVLEQVVFNLLSNAVKFTPAGGRIDIDVEQSGDDVHFRIADTGIGIGPELQQRIFEPFERGAVAGSGTGIGLALVREIVTSLGGEVTLTSSAGEGAAFDVRLPCCGRPSSGELQNQAAAERIADAETEALDRALEKATVDVSTPRLLQNDDKAEVLVVEDNAELRQFLVETLGESFRVAAADDGLAGLDLAQKELPDIIVSDVMMPAMDGFEFCRAIKSDQRTSHIPVILLTAREDRDSLLKGLEEGADDYLTKPFDAAALRLRVRNILETRQMLRARLAAELDRTTGTASADEPPSAVLARRDQEFLRRLTDYLQKHFADADLTVADIADGLALSERQLQRKLKALVNRNPSEHLRIFRLHRAAEMIRAGGAIGAVAAETGFTSSSHFAACFKALFNTTPSEYQRSSDQ